MSRTSEEILNRVENLNTYRSGERRAPHKPLLLLIAIGKLKAGEHQLPLSEIEQQLLPLLKAYAPPVVSRHQPELPFWYLQSDGLWEIDDADNLPRQKGGFPRLGALRKTYGQFPDDVANALVNEPGLADEVVHRLLLEHFPQSLHADLLAVAGLDASDDVPAMLQNASRKRSRDPRFRQEVLRAYEHRCAVTGFRASLGGTYFGCEAAHVQWHACDGPDLVENGLSLEPTLHKLFDAGAWTLTDDHRVLVSAEYTGSDSAIHRLRERHGQKIAAPISAPFVSVEFIKWHREQDLGGVFREPALGL